MTLPARRRSFVILVASLVAVVVVAAILVFRPAPAFADSDVRAIAAAILQRVAPDGVTEIVADETQAEGEFAVVSMHVVGGYQGGGQGIVALARLVGGRWTFALPGEEVFLTWLTVLPQTLLTDYLSFVLRVYRSPKSAVPPAGVTFRYPFLREAQYALSRPPEAKVVADDDATRYAYTYAMPDGAPIAAAADGQIVVAYDGSKVSGCSVKAWGESNRLVVRHSDGTDTLYMHLAPGSIVKRGGSVKSGEVIAKAGRTGWFCATGTEGAGLRVQRQRGSTNEDWFQAPLPLTFAGPQDAIALATPRPTPSPSPSPASIVTWKDTGTGSSYQCSSDAIPNPQILTIRTARCRAPAATIGVSSRLSDGFVKVNPLTGTVYVASAAPNQLTVIDPSGAVVGTVPLSPSTATAGMRLALNAATRRVYVTSVVATNIDPNASPNKLYVVDGFTNRVIATPNVANFPQGVAVNAATNRVYVGEANPSSLVVLDGDTHAIVARTKLDVSATEIEVDATRNLVYVDTGQKTIVVLDGTSLAVRRSWSHSDPQASRSAIGDCSIPGAIAAGTNLTLNAPLDRVYVTDRCAGTITVFDGASGQVVNKVDTGNQLPLRGPRGLAIDPLTNRVYVTFVDSMIVATYDAELKSTGFLYLMDQWPIAGDVDPRTGKLYVATFSTNKLMVLDAYR